MFNRREATLNEELPKEQMDASASQPSDATVAEDDNHDTKSDFVQLGALLASARKKSGLSKEQVARKLKIKEANLTAIESGDLASITMPLPFLRGFLREYCNLLGAENIWREYDRITATSSNKKSNIAKSSDAQVKKYGIYNVDVATPRSRIFLITFLILTALIVAFFAYQMRSDIASQAISPENIVMGLNPFDKIQSEEEDKTATKDIVPPNEDSESENKKTKEERKTAGETKEQTEPQENQKKSLPTDPASFGWLDKKEQEKEIAKPLAEKPDLPPTEKRTITIKAVNVLWVRVSTPNRRIFQGLMKKGEVKTYEVGAIPLIVRYGKGNKALVTWDGVEKLVSDEPKPITVKYTTEAR